MPAGLIGYGGGGELGVDFDTKTFSKIKLYYIGFLTKHVGPWYFSFDKSFGQKKFQWACN